MGTITAPEVKSQLTCTEALDQAYHLALEKLPEEVHTLVAKGLALVQNGGVFETDGHRWEVLSQSEPDKKYHVNGSCQCTWSEYNPGGTCAHQYAVFLQRKALRLLQQEQQTAPQAISGDISMDQTPPVAPQEEVPAQAPAHQEPVQTEVRSRTRQVPKEYLVTIDRKPFVTLAGLVAMAHDEGLVSLTETWDYNDAELSLAHASALFADGRTFTGCGDATPLSGKKVGLAWRRMSLSRAKARALRDSLAINACSVEEME
jgi:hypothetical protein